CQFGGVVVVALATQTDRALGPAIIATVIIVIIVSVIWGAGERIKTMSESDTALHDEEVLSDGLPDAVLEVAGGKCWEGPASSVTIGFCSGPETCPMGPGTNEKKLSQ